MKTYVNLQAQRSGRTARMFGEAKAMASSGKPVTVVVSNGEDLAVLAEKFGPFPKTMSVIHKSKTTGMGLWQCLDGATKQGNIFADHKVLEGFYPAILAEYHRYDSYLVKPLTPEQFSEAVKTS